MISQKDDGTWFGEVIENGYYFENESWAKVLEELDAHDA